MFCQAGFDQWLTTIMQHLSPLSKPQATVLALWSFGMVLARSCGVLRGPLPLLIPVSRQLSAISSSPTASTPRWTVSPGLS